MLISVTDLINKSIELYKKNWKLFLKYMLWLFIPTGILAVVSIIFGSFKVILLAYGLALPAITYSIVIIIASIFSLWISLAFVRTLAARYQQKEANNVPLELHKTKHLLIPAILISLLTSLIILGGIILLIIPGIIFAIWLAFSFYAVAIEENKVMDSLSTSKKLVNGRWWLVFWRLVAPAIIFGIVLLLVNWLLSMPFEVILRNMEKGSIAFTIVMGILTLISTVVSLLFTPLTTAAPTILYLELKKTPLVPKNPEPSATTPSEPPIE